ncbi:sialidase family protein [Streptomyces polygonati]|uniref:exo-alpha-sialidase n=1 Tax=Streptomyces polygonati TaxID=1617087 RepID=A0ABV8HN05_9ACTN
MAVVTRGRVWPAPLIVLVLAVLTSLLVPRLATGSTPAPTSANAATSDSSTSYAHNFTKVTTAYTDTVSHGDGTRVPDIISTSADDAVVVWREGIVPGHVDQGYIRYSYTTNAGTGWSQPQMLVQETDDMTWNNVALFHTGNQIFAYVTGAPASAASHGGDHASAVVVKRSTDEGHSWSTYATNLDDIAKRVKTNIAFSGHPIQLGPNSYAMPYWASGRENGTLISSDLSTWTPNTTAAATGGLLPGENQIAVSQDDSGNGKSLVMVARASGNAAVATSSDGGHTWGQFRDDDPGMPLPSSNIAKDFFAKDSNGQYLYIYNPATEQANRSELAYKVKPAGGSWGPQTFLLDTVLGDDPEQPSPPGGAGWDTYPMASEYAPGKFYVVWEADTMHIMVGKLDVSGTA